jgi:DNA polymerase III delta prime subunit
MGRLIDETKNPLWTERYRPRTVDETILPAELHAVFKRFVELGTVPNLLLHGPAGTGKTTVARAVLDELGVEYIVINGSMNGNIDTLRNEILTFASSVSLSGGRKYVILDEADYLNANSTQPALRNFMEQFSGNAGFILTCNYPSRIIPEIHSRCSVIDFRFPKSEVKAMCAALFKRVRFILDSEGVEYEPRLIGELLLKYYPDTRRLINELQLHSATGKLDVGAMTSRAGLDVTGLVALIRDRDYTGARVWVSDNLDSNHQDLFRRLYDSSIDLVKPQCVPALVTLIGKYQYQAAFVADQEINVMALIAEIMVEGLYQ